MFNIFRKEEKPLLISLYLFYILGLLGLIFSSVPHSNVAQIIWGLFAFPIIWITLYDLLDELPKYKRKYRTLSLSNEITIRWRERLVSLAKEFIKYAEETKSDDFQKIFTSLLNKNYDYYKQGADWRIKNAHMRLTLFLKDIQKGEVDWSIDNYLFICYLIDSDFLLFPIKDSVDTVRIYDFVDKSFVLYSIQNELLKQGISECRNTKIKTMEDVVYAYY